MNLAAKLLKNSTSQDANILEHSIFMKERDMIETPVPMLNVALSGDIHGGYPSGVTVLAGPSKNFKSGFALLFAGAYLKKYKDAALLFYDTEFGMPENYFDMFEIDKSRVVHTPISDIEQLKFDAVKQLKELDRGDKCIIVIDSVGNAASKKELDDAEAGKSVADMSRAKALKSFFRMVTPLAAMKDIPVIVINHTYKEIGLFPKDVVSGGTGVYYSADTIWILGRQQEKDGKDLKGYNFVINVDKSRFVKEKSKILINASFDTGISKWSGMFDAALELGIITVPAKGWYEMEGYNKFRRADVESSDQFWTDVLKDTDFAEKLKNRYSLSSEYMLGENNE